MKKRIFFAVLFLFLLFFHSTLMIISLISLRDNLSAVREKGLFEHHVIASALIGDIQALDSRGIAITDSIDGLMNRYSHYTQDKKNGFAVAFEGKWIFKTAYMLPKVNPVELEDKSNGQERIVFIENNLNPILCVYGSFPAPFQDYGLLYTSDLSNTLASWRHTKNLLFFIGALVTLLLAVCLLKFLEIIFRSLEQIAKASITIANGEYQSRLPVNGKDEIADMAHSFNLMAQQVESHIKLLQDTAEQKQQFIDNFAHELRTPLTAIYGYAEYIQKASALSEEECFECTHFIMTECERLQNMAYQLLELAMLREIAIEDCDIKELFACSDSAMQVKAAQKEMKLIYDSAGYIVRGNPELLLSLLNNLIDNAIKASSPDSVVHISSFREKSHTVIEVKDYGSGMDKEQLSHIKEAFYRVDKARSRTAGGAGLGLSICDRIAGLHHANLVFSSDPGKGTTARIIF